MNKINGIEISRSHLQINEFVGTLLFAEYPTTIIYSDFHFNPIVKEWVDCSDDRKIDRYFYFKTSPAFLKKFIEGEINHYDFIQSSIDGFLYFSDEVQGAENITFEILSLKQLNSDYKPSASYFFSPEDGVELEKIVSFFQLNSMTIVEDVLQQTQQIAIDKKAEVITLNFKKARGIRFGTINTEILTDILSKFDRIYKNICFDVFNGTSRSDLLSNFRKNSNYDDQYSTEILQAFPGSYNIVLRPLYSHYDLYTNETEPYKIISTFFSLFENSNDLELLKEEYSSHSEYTINAYKDLLKNIFDVQQDINFIWANPKEVKTLSKSIHFNTANNIINNLINLSIVSSDTFTKKGKFRAIHCDTGHFVFNSNDDEQFSGYFDKSILEGTERIIFINEYEVKINRKVIKEAGKNKPKISDTIFSFFENISNETI